MIIVRTKEEKMIWSAIVQSICVHCQKELQPRSITPQTLLIELFPTKNGRDEQANRLGNMMINLFEYFNRVFHLRLQMDYEPRQEFQLFKDVESVYRYWLKRILNK